MSHAEPVSQRRWSDWFFERVPLPPALFGALLAAALLGLLALLAAATGTFDRLAVRNLTWWQSRDGRIAVLLTLLAGTIPAALRYHELGTRRNLHALARANLWPVTPAALHHATSGSLRAAKRAELARVHAAIRGDAGALRGSPLGQREHLSLADLLAWRAFVEEIPEWPIDVSTVGRFGVYVGIPLLGWVGAALVQHALESALG